MRGRVLRWLGHRRWFAAAGRRFGAPLDRALYRRDAGPGVLHRRRRPADPADHDGASHRVCPRTTPVMYVRDGDCFVVSSENFGQERAAAWPLNLLADPRATVQVGAETVACRARLLERRGGGPLLAAPGRGLAGARDLPVAQRQTPHFRAGAALTFVTPGRSGVLRSVPTLAGMLGRERGQATVEWSALGLMLALLFATAAFAVARTDAVGASATASCTRSCAPSKGAARSATRSTSRTATTSPALVRRYSAERRVRAQQRRAADRLPPLSQDRLLGRVRRGARDRPLTRRAARHGLHARGRPALAAAAPLYLQYWFYYPESFTGGDRPHVRRLLARLSPGRLGGLPGAGHARGRRLRARYGARRLRHGLGALDGVDARFGRQPRGPPGRAQHGRAQHPRLEDRAGAAGAAGGTPTATDSRCRRRGTRTSTGCPSRPVPEQPGAATRACARAA